MKKQIVFIVFLLLLLVCNVAKGQSYHIDIEPKQINVKVIHGFSEWTNFTLYNKGNETIIGRLYANDDFNDFNDPVITMIYDWIEIPPNSSEIIDLQVNTAIMTTMLGDFNCQIQLYINGTDEYIDLNVMRVTVVPGPGTFVCCLAPIILVIIIILIFFIYRAKNRGKYMKPKE